MQELDDVWSQMLADAADKARSSGRADVADYLGLKASNDLIRRASVQWLFDTLIQEAAAANRTRTAVAIERIEPHSFFYRGANLVGSSVSFRYGVRCLTAEAGWTRTPTDGFMRGGGLAFARLRHFGLPNLGVDLVLTRSDEAPLWRVITQDSMAGEIEAAHLTGHIHLLTET